MKKIILIIVLTLCIFQLIVLAIDITIGWPAIDRSASIGAYTAINNNPANESGIINSVEIWCDTSLVNCEVATFYKPDPSGFPNNFSTRDTEVIGPVVAGAKRTFSVDLTVVAGDYIGIYYTGGSIERDSSGAGGMWYKTDDRIPCVDLTFTVLGTSAVSICGTGTTLEPPDPPTNVQATNGTYTGYVRITWTKSGGAIDYQVYRDDVGLGWLGDVATYDDTGADPPTINHGSITASDGTFTACVALSNTGESVSVGTTHTYKVKARNAAGESGDSLTDTGYRGASGLTYQWYKSAGDSDDSYSPIDGATSSTYDDTAAPAPTITPGTASASDGISSEYVTLSIAGESANVGAGRYYKCYHTSGGAIPGYTGVNRGYKGVGILTYQWQRSLADSDTDYSNIDGAITDPYNDTGAPADGSGRYYRCLENATGAIGQISTSDRGYRAVEEEEAFNTFFFGTNI